MRDALRQIMEHPKAQRVFRQRKAMVEPVFAHLRCQQKLERFRRRGLAAVRREFALHGTSIQPISCREAIERPVDRLI